MTATSSKALNRSLEAKLAALDGPEWESSDDEDDVENVEEEEEEVVDNLVSTSKEVKQNPKQKKTSVPNKSSSVIYLGHLPVGFEEYELRGFLSQFGTIQRLRLARSKKTARPKGFAFIEFEDPEVASIVAETMGGYLLLEKRLVCHVVPPERVHPRMFHGGTHWKQVDWRKLHRDQVNQERSAAKLKKITARLLSREKKKRETLKELGMDYDFPGYENSATKENAEEKTTEKVETKDSRGKKRRKNSHDEKESKENKVTSTDKEVKQSGEEQDSTKKRRKMSHDEKDQKSSLMKKKKRKNSNAEEGEQQEATPKKQEPIAKAQTDVKKKKKKNKKHKKADKKRRQSAPL